MSAPLPLPIEIRHRRGMAFFMLACSVFILGTSFLVGVSLNTLTGALLLVVSIAYLTQPAIVATESGLEHRNLLGMTLRRTDYRSLADLDVEPDGSFVITRGGTKEKVRGVLRFFLDAGDLKRLEDAIRDAKPSA